VSKDKNRATDTAVAGGDTAGRATDTAADNI
jgi:hypothetical protein